MAGKSPVNTASMTTPLISTILPTFPAVLPLSVGM
jgi:hypothetical protein